MNDAYAQMLINSINSLNTNLADIAASLAVMRESLMSIETNR